MLGVVISAAKLIKWYLIENEIGVEATPDSDAPRQDVDWEV